jgi:hypothetical protein
MENVTGSIHVNSSNNIPSLFSLNFTDKTNTPIEKSKDLNEINVEPDMPDFMRERFTFVPGKHSNSRHNNNNSNNDSHSNKSHFSNNNNNNRRQAPYRNERPRFQSNDNNNRQKNNSFRNNNNNFQNVDTNTSDQQIKSMIAPIVTTPGITTISLMSLMNADLKPTQPGLEQKLNNNNKIETNQNESENNFNSFDRNSNRNQNNNFNNNNNNNNNNNQWNSGRFQGTKKSPKNSTQDYKKHQKIEIKPNSAAAAALAIANRSNNNDSQPSTASQPTNYSNMYTNSGSTQKNISQVNNPTTTTTTTTVPAGVPSPAYPPGYIAATATTNAAAAVATPAYPGYPAGYPAMDPYTASAYQNYWSQWQSQYYYQWSQHANYANMSSSSNYAAVNQVAPPIPTPVVSEAKLEKI